MSDGTIMLMIIVGIMLPSIAYAIEVLLILLWEIYEAISSLFSSEKTN